MVMQNMQSIAGGGFVPTLSGVGYPIELWGMGFSLWTNIILSIIIMGASVSPSGGMMSSDGSQVELDLRDLLLAGPALLRSFGEVASFLVPGDHHHPLDCARRAV